MLAQSQSLLHPFSFEHGLESAYLLADRSDIETDSSSDDSGSDYDSDPDEVTRNFRSNNKLDWVVVVLVGLNVIVWGMVFAMWIVDEAMLGSEKGCGDWQVMDRVWD